MDLNACVRICVHLGGLPVQESISIMAYEFNQPQQNFGLQTETETRPSGRNLPLMDPNGVDKGKINFVSDGVPDHALVLEILGCDQSVLLLIFF